MTTKCRKFCFNSGCLGGDGFFWTGSCQPSTSLSLDTSAFMMVFSGIALMGQYGLLVLVPICVLNVNCIYSTPLHTATFIKCLGSWCFVNCRVEFVSLAMNCLLCVCVVTVRRKIMTSYVVLLVLFQNLSSWWLSRVSTVHCLVMHLKESRGCVFWVLCQHPCPKFSWEP